MDSSDLDADPVLLSESLSILSGADFVTIKVHGDTSIMKRFERLRTTLEANGVCTLMLCTDEDVTADHRWMFDGTDEEYDLALTYYSLGGNENFRNLILWALGRFDGANVGPSAPVVPPAQGLYYPGREDIDIASYLDGIPSDRPVIGIFFYQKQWLTRNLGNIDGLIRAVEAAGGVPVPVFMRTYPDDLSGSIGVRRILAEELTRDGRPVLDAIIETMSFSQTLVASPGCGEQVCEDNFFESYGVPVIQAMTVACGLDEWRDNVFGLSPAEVAYDVAHPEFDGQIIGVPSAVTERCGDTWEYTSVPDRAERIADTAVMWGSLRRKGNRDRRVAVLLYMYPPKLANAGGASGLDTFASVVDLLHRLRDEGYDVGDAVPDDPRELSDLLLEGLTNDMDWLSEDEIRRRSADVVPLSTYERWYAGLTEASRSRLESGWGAPLGTSTRSTAGSSSREGCSGTCSWGSSRTGGGTSRRATMTRRR